MIETTGLLRWPRDENGAGYDDWGWLTLWGIRNGTK